MSDRKIGEERSRRGVPENIESSLQSAITALGHLASNLEAGGFAEGASSYQEMSRVIIAQRLALSSPSPLDDDFDHVAHMARQVHSLLRPYTECMLQLSALNDLGSVSSHRGSSVEGERDSLLGHESLVPDGIDGVERRLLTAIASRPRPASATSLASEVGLTSRETIETLASLAEAGLVLERRSGSRTLYLMA